MMYSKSIAEGSALLRRTLGVYAAPDNAEYSALLPENFKTPYLAGLLGQKCRETPADIGPLIIFGQQVWTGRAG